MTAVTFATASDIGSAPASVAGNLSATLRAIHGRWIAEASRWVAPAIARSANFWDGWSAARYLGDQFDRQYRRGRVLVATILPLLRPVDASVLHTITEALDRTRRDLSRLGRRQGATAAVAAASHRFLELLRAWFAEIERVGEGLTRDELPASGRRALAQLEAAAAIRRGGSGRQ